MQEVLTLWFAELPTPNQSSEQRPIKIHSAKQLSSALCFETTTLIQHPTNQRLVSAVRVSHSSVAVLLIKLFQLVVLC